MAADETREEDAPGGSPAWTRGAWIALAVLVLGALIHLPWRVCPWYDRTLVTADGAMYLIAAKSILAGEGYSYLGEPFTLRPPGLPLLVLPVMAVVGADMAVLSAFIGLVSVVCVALLFGYQRPRLGTLVAFAVAVAVWLNPGFQRLSNQVMSDVPGAALMFAGLLVDRWARRRPSMRRELVLGVVTAAACVMRSINVFLIPAIVLARAIETWRTGEGERPWWRFALRRLVPVAAIPFLLMLPWSLRNAHEASDAPAEHTLVHSYGVAMFHQDIGDPGSPLVTRAQFGTRVEHRVRDLGDVLGSRLQQRRGSATHRRIAWAALACWAVVLVVRRRAGDFLTGAMILLVCVYFGFQPRLVLPIWLMVFPAVAQVALWALRPLVGARVAAPVVAALVLALGLWDFEPHFGWDKLRAQDEPFREMAAWVEQNVPPERTLAAQFGGHWSVELDRPVYTLLAVLRRDGVPGANRFIEEHGVDGLILNDKEPGDRPLIASVARFREPVARVGTYTYWSLRP